ncbi:PRD domain-containing protein, partial [Thomasclavelia sp.]|uniref:PRD domain-containing protein n=1 Tax=Thomasclavelia sp. TaxID=3025757 RepID=UPI0025EDBFB3
ALLMLADHINETVKRLKKGIYLTNALTNEIQTFYKDEYNVASEACDHLKTVYNVNLNNDEIAFIATHLINLNLDNINETLHSIEIVDEVVDIIRRYLNIELKANTYEYSRFITHLKYFSLRVMKRESINSNYDEKLELFIKENYQRVYKCTLVIKSYIARRYGYNITNAEVVYLAIHLQNILNN